MPRHTRGGFLVAAAGAVVSLSASPAAAATEEDGALLRLAASAELLEVAFLYRALTSRRFDRKGRAELRRMRLADGRHYRELVAAIGPGAPVAGDLDLLFPNRAFASRSAVVALGTRIERAVLGIHLTAAASLSTPELRTLAARVAASEAAHVAFFAGTVGDPLPSLFDAQRATDLLAPYWG